MRGHALRAAGLSIRRGDRTVLRDVHAGVDHGELVCIAGPNGAGKSTLLAALAGDLTPAQGTVEVLGEPIGKVSTARLATLRSFLPQQHQVAFGFTAAEIVEMGLAPHRGRGPVSVEEAMTRLDVTHLAHRTFRSLSGGEQARVALARVLVQAAPILLLDEPTAALDLRHQDLVMRIGRAEADAGRAVVVIVHDLNLAAAHAHRIVLLDDGRVLADGAPREVLRADLLEQAYRIPVLVIDHPTRDCPLVLPDPGPADRGTGVSDPSRRAGASR